MEAIHTQSSEKQASANLSTTIPGASWLDTLAEKSEFNRFAIISMAFMIIGIVGGITVGFFAHDFMWQIGLIVGVTMASLVLMLAVAPMKYIISATAFALLVDVLMMVFGMLA